MNLASVQECFRLNKDEVAAIIVEPVAGNMGVIPPAEGFLQGLREECDRNGALLIFDEVITGFRLGLGGAAEYYGVTPDLTTLGKIIGGGFAGGSIWREKGIAQSDKPVRRGVSGRGHSLVIRWPVRLGLKCSNCLLNINHIGDWPICVKH